jgi:hypothetical protein
MDKTMKIIRALESKCRKTYLYGMIPPPPKGKKERKKENKIKDNSDALEYIRKGGHNNKKLQRKDCNKKGRYWRLFIHQPK